MKRQRFYCFIYFAQKHGYPLEWKIGETPRLANNVKSRTCTMNNFVLLVVPGLSSIPAAVCLQHRDPRISKLIPENRLLSDPVTARSDKLARGKPMLTDPDKQATGNREPAYEKNQTRGTRRIQRKVFLIGYSPSQLISRTWSTCARRFL